MSYTWSDPENYNRDPDTSSLASTSTTASQLSKSNKKPWSKLKSSLKSIGRRMSTGSKPNFAEPTESSERRKSKKNKRAKESSSTSTSDVNPSSSGEKPREKSPSKGPKNLIKKLSVEAISTPFVGYQPSSVSPSRSYAKAVSKSPGSTSESNLSFSDLDSPRKASTLDRSTKFSFGTQESLDSGRVSQAMDDSRPPSQVTEEGYASGPQRDASDLSVDSDYTPVAKSAVKEVPFESLVSKTAQFARPSPQKDTSDSSVDSAYTSGGKQAAKEVPFESLVSKTAQFAQSLVPPKEGQENNTVASATFIKAETVTKPPEPTTKTTKPADVSNVETKKGNGKESSVSKVEEIKTEDLGKLKGTDKKEQDDKTKSNTIKPGVDEVEGRKSGKQNVTTKKDAASADFIKSEQSKTSTDDTSNNLTTENGTSSKDKPVGTEKSAVIEEKPKTEPSVVSTEEKSKKDTSRGKKQEDKSAAESKSDKSSGKTKTELQTTTKDKKEDKPADASKNGSKKTQEAPKPETSAESASKSLPASSDVVSPLDLMEPPASTDPKATQMTVEEKLEAFLSAEGWSGTIKDADNKPSPDGSQQPDKRECLYKILVIGELGTGKTSIIKRYVHQFFSQHYRATIGVDFALKVINWDPSTIIRLQLWDIAGQERFGNMTRVYYKEAVGAFIVFDVTRSATFDAVLKWKQDLDSKVQLADGSPIPCVLLANKCDQQKEGIVNTPAKMDEYCKENNFSAWFETSAKEDINIDDAAKSLVTQILQNDKLSQNGRDSMKDGKFPLDGKSEEEGKSCAC